MHCIHCCSNQYGCNLILSFSFLSLSLLSLLFPYIIPSLSYTLTVPPIITITATQIGPQDYRITCEAIAYPRIYAIELIEDRNGDRTVVHGSATRSSTVSDTFDYEALAEYSGSNNCPVVYYCFVNTSFHDRTESNGTCQTSEYSSYLVVLIRFY